MKPLSMLFYATMRLNSFDTLFIFLEHRLKKLLKLLRFLKSVLLQLYFLTPTGFIFEICMSNEIPVFR